MINMLIANKDIFKLKDIVNQVTSNINIRISKIAINEKETLDALTNDNIDVSFID